MRQTLAVLAAAALLSGTIATEEHERIAGFIHIGRPPGPPEDRPRPPLNEIAVRFTASNPEADRSLQAEHFA